MVASIAELPFHERPLLEALNLHEHRAAPDLDWRGFGWARAPRLWLAEGPARPDGAPVRPEGVLARPVDDTLLLVLHCPDDGERLADDIELYFELSSEDPVTVLASAFLASWLPRLPEDVSAIVLALCNPHNTWLPQPKATRLPVHFALGDVESWRAPDGRLVLRALSWHVARDGCAGAGDVCAGG